LQKFFVVPTIIDNQHHSTQKLCLCLHLLGGESDIISTVSSWKDTMDDEIVLGCLDTWIEGTLAEQKRTISHVEKAHNKQ